MVEQNYVEAVVQVDGGHFVDTQISTAVLVLKKRRSEREIRFLHGEREVKVAFEEIEKNNFDLTVSHYLPQAVEREAVDIVKLNAEIETIVAREDVLRNEINSIIAEIEGKG